MFEKNIFNFQESIAFEKMRRNENSGFYFIYYAKMRVKMTYFYRVCTEARCKAIKKIFSFKSVLSLLSIYGMF